jgi:hypothetical protein
VVGITCCLYHTVQITCDYRRLEEWLDDWGVASVSGFNIQVVAIYSMYMRSAPLLWGINSFATDASHMRLDAVFGR